MRITSTENVNNNNIYFVDPSFSNVPLFSMCEDFKPANKRDNNAAETIHFAIYTFLI
jgi:hypothetical protein